MSKSAATLGVSVSSDNLYYAVHNPEEGDGSQLTYLGAVDFSFNIRRTLASQSEDHFPAVKKTIGDLKNRFDVGRLRILTHPAYECWCTLPKLVYDKADEREAYLNILMRGSDRSSIEPLWFGLSNQNFKLLLVRNKKIMDGYRILGDLVGSAEYFSDFEIGQQWVQFTSQRGSFLTVSIQENLLSIASFLLGKLRAATYIKFDEFRDLPYLWLQRSQHLKWLNGIHEYIYVYGEQSEQLIDTLKPYWDDAASILSLNTLDRMRIQAPEARYNFSLAEAFPAVLMALPEDAEPG